MKIAPLLFLAFLTTSLSVMAQSDVIPLWPEGIPCENDLTEEVRNDDRIGRVISKVHEPSLTVYLPPVEKRNGTSVVICPGGGYTVLAWDWEGTKMAEWFNSFGISAFVLKYRLPKWETEECRSKVALMDAKRAVRIVRSNVKEWGLDAERIGIMGFSAGGHLASTAITHFDLGDKKAKHPVDHESSRPDFAILMYPVVTMDTNYAHMGSRTNLIGKNPSKDMLHLYSNEAQVTEDTPPTILIHANDDEGVVPENSINFFLALRKNGVPAAMHIYEKGGHGFSFGEGKGAVEAWRDECKNWMKDRGLVK